MDKSDGNSMSSRQQSFGVHRVLEPPGQLPYAAAKLDPSSPVRAGEIEVAVESLHVDSASWTQLREECGDSEARMRARIEEIVAAGGKMHNPVTGSGGMLIGEVTALGEGRDDLEIGDRIFTLVSMTCTPLELEEIHSFDPASPQLKVRGRAYVFASAPYTIVPDDLDEAVALGVADIAGAPARAAELAKPGMNVVVIGAGGRAGSLACAASVEQVGDDGRVLALCWPPSTATSASSVGAEVEEVDCSDPLAVLAAVEGHFGERMADLVMLCVNVPGCEAGAILASAEDGEVVFFSMATSFPAAALIAESLSRTCRLTVGNGYLPGHTEFAFDLARRLPQLHELLGH